MALKRGTKIGSYEIVSLLGVGGMGEVYGDRDGRLGRDVALKILPTAFVCDEDRLRQVGRPSITLSVNRRAPTNSGVRACPRDFRPTRKVGRSLLVWRYRRPCRPRGSVLRRRSRRGRSWR
jgi:hypothetical protein